MQKKHRKYLYKGLIITVLFFFISSRTFFFKKSILENISSALTYPTLLISSSISSKVKEHFSNKKNLQKLEEELGNKTLENEKLLTENIKLKASIHHSKQTSELLNFQKRFNLDNGIFSKVLISNIDDQQHYYIVNKGSRNGVKQDMVMIYKFQLVGRVSEVFSHHSKIKLITDNKSKIAVYTNMTQAQGIALGNNKPNRCKLEYVSHLSKVENDDFVLSSGQGLVFPEGFCLGKIISNKVNGFVHNIELEPVVDFNTLKFGILIDRTQIINF